MRGFFFRFPENAVAMTFQRLAERFLEFFVPDCGSYKHFSVSGQAVGICLFGIFAGVLIAMLVTAYEKSLHADFVGSVIDLGAADAEHAVTLGELGFLKNRRVRREFRDGAGLSKYVRCVEEEAWKSIEWVPVSAGGNVSDHSATAEPAGKEESGAGTLPDGRVFAGKPDAADSVGVAGHADMADGANAANDTSAADTVNVGVADGVCATERSGAVSDGDVTSDADTADSAANGGNPGAEQTTGPQYRFDFETAHFYLPEENRIAAEVRYAPQKKRGGGLILSVLALVALYILMIFLTPELLQLLDNCLGLLAG